MCLGAKSAETMALKNGPMLLQHLGCSKVVVESDCLAVVEAANDLPNYFGANVAIFAECYQMSREFGKLSYQHCSREANKIADSLAKFGTSGEVHRFWEDDPPDFISSMIVNDMAII